jgi:hypothetical protein
MCANRCHPTPAIPKRTIKRGWQRIEKHALGTFSANGKLVEVAGVEPIFMIL